jgi:molybdopterin synthase catalytic subunit
MMDINAMIEALKAQPHADRIGMIATHLGVVRGSSRDGREVTGIEVTYDPKAVEAVKHDIKKLPGILDVLVETREGRLGIGEDLLAVAVAGDIREHVFSALVQAVDRLKKEAGRKREFFKDDE